jgi:hypothetical protein
LSTTNPTWLDPALNPGRRGGKSASHPHNPIPSPSRLSKWQLFKACPHLLPNDMIPPIAASLISLP